MSLAPYFAMLRQQAGRLPLIGLLGLLGALGLARPASAAFYVVTNTSDSGTGSLRAALASAAVDGDTQDYVEFQTNVTGTITLLTGQLTISKRLILVGPGQSVLTISGDNASRVFQITAGAVYISGLTITGGHVTGSAPSPQYGAGIDVEGSGNLDLSDSTITGCTASHASGGGIALNSGPNTLTNCTVSGNTASSFGSLGGAGGGLYLNDQTGGGATYLSVCTFSGNTASGGGSTGGGLYAGSALSATNATFSGNTALLSGGGISDAGQVSLTSCTVAGNTVTGSGGHGGGIDDSGTALTLQGTLVATNQAPSSPDLSCTGSAAGTSQGSNLIGNGTGSLGFTNAISHDQVGTAAAPIAPMLGTLQVNEGTTSTLALLPGSPAIDADYSGDAAPATDQRGVVRPQGARADIGAYEVYQGRALVVTNTTDSGTGSLRLALTEANNDIGDTVTFATGLTGTITLTGGELPLAHNMTITGPGAAILSVSGGGTSRVLHMTGGTIAISGLTLTGGSIAASGGGILEGSGTLVLSGCILSANSATNGSGGGISAASGATLSVTNCIFSGNAAQFSGGGVDGEGSLTVQGCTFSGNSATSSGGGLLVAGTASVTSSTLTANSSNEGGGIFSQGALTLRSCTISGNTLTTAGVGGGLAVASGGRIILTGCLVAGNVAGTGAADPDVEQGTGGTFASAGSNLIGDGTGGPFVNGSAHDQVGTTAAPILPKLGPLQNNGGATPTLALLTGSPAIDANYTGTAPAADQRGFHRPQGARPDIGAFEYPSTPIHILWNTSSGVASVWNEPFSGGAYTYHNYGPFSGWSANAIADGPDGRTRLLWDKTDGTASIWSLDNNTGSYTFYNFGPFPGYTAAAISVGADNTTHVLWNKTDGTASIWNYSTDSGLYSYHNYGPYPGWSAIALADGPDDNTRVLWDNVDGRMSLDDYTLSTGNYTVNTFGPFTHYTAVALSVGADNTTHILWNNFDGTASIWNYTMSGSTGSFTYHNYGPYDGWSAKAVADEPDGRTRVLWDRANGQMSLWSLDNAAGIYTFSNYGPFAGYTATALSQGR